MFKPQTLPGQELQKPARRQLANLNWGGILSVILGALAALGVLWPTIDYWHLRRLSPAAAASTIYHRLRGHGRRIAVPMQTGDTPHEFSVAFAQHVDGLTWREKKLGTTILAPVVNQVQSIIEYHIRAAYSPHPPQEGARELIRLWRALRRRLLVLWLHR